MAANDRQTEEQHFCDIFQEVLDDVIEGEEISEEDVRESLESIIEAFNFTAGRSLREVDWTDYANVCGYVYRYGPHSAGLTRRRVLEAVTNCEQLAEATGKSRLRVVSLGGGPGSDALGFCSALHEVNKDCVLDITVTDAYEEWGTCVSEMTRLAREGGFGNVSEMSQRNNVTVGFIQRRLPASPQQDEAFQKALRQADIVIMAKLLSSLTLSEIPEIIQDLYQTMKAEALFLLIDSPLSLNDARRLQYNKFDFFHPHFELLYLSEAGAYTMRSEAPRRFGFSNQVSSAAQIAVLRKSEF